MLELCVCVWMITVRVLLYPYCSVSTDEAMSDCIRRQMYKASPGSHRSYAIIDVVLAGEAERCKVCVSFK